MGSITGVNLVDIYDWFNTRNKGENNIYLLHFKCAWY